MHFCGQEAFVLLSVFCNLNSCRIAQRPGKKGRITWKGAWDSFFLISSLPDFSWQLIIPNCLPRWWFQSSPSLAVHQSPCCSISWMAVGIVGMLSWLIWVGGPWYIFAVLICIFVIQNEGEYFFRCLLAIWLSSRVIRPF